MDMGDWRALATVLCTLGFLAVTLWAYSGRRAEAFREASLLPFAEEDQPGAKEETAR